MSKVANYGLIILTKLLWGSHATPHNEFQGWTQVLPMVKAVNDLCPQRMQVFELA